MPGALEIASNSEELKMANQDIYTKYLEEMGYSEQEVLAILDPAEMTGNDAIGLGAAIGIFAQMLGSEKSTDQEKEYAKSIIQSMSSNTNWLLREVIDGRLKKRFRETGVRFYEDGFPGVFPTNDYNARTVSKYPGLVLFDTACFELIAAFVWVGMWDASYEERAEHVGDIANMLFTERKLPPKSALEHKSLNPHNPGVAGKKVWIGDITTAAEEFILAHEYGHLTLHMEKPGRNVTPNRRTQEFEADNWAVSALLRPNSLWGTSSRGVKLGYETQIAGLCTALGIAHFMECFAPHPESSEYPSAKERLGVLVEQIGRENFCKYAGWGLPLLDLASAVAMYLVLGKAGLSPPQTQQDLKRVLPLIINVG